MTDEQMKEQLDNAQRYGQHTSLLSWINYQLRYRPLSERCSEPVSISCQLTKAGMYFHLNGIYDNQHEQSPTLSMISVYATFRPRASSGTFFYQRSLYLTNNLASRSLDHTTTRMRRWAMRWSSKPPSSSARAALSESVAPRACRSFVISIESGLYVLVTLRKNMKPATQRDL